MKNFENKFEKAATGCDIGVECSNLRCEECKTIAEYWYRQALEFAREQLAYDRAPCVGIEQELGDKKLETKGNQK